MTFSAPIPAHIDRIFRRFAPHIAALCQSIQKSEILDHHLRELEAANKVKSTFLATMSHEIRTPLNSIMGFSQLLANDLTQTTLGTQIPAFITQIKNSAQTLNILIQDILEYSQIQSGKISLVIKPFTLEPFFRQIFQQFQARAHDRQIQFSYSISPALPLQMASDNRRIRQILSNILNNACKFTGPQKAVRMEFLGDDNQLIMVVKDEGKGIVAEKLEEILQPFQQEDSQPTRLYEGVGLGLSISSELIRMLKGTLKIESILAQGTTVTVTIPNQQLNSATNKKQPSELIPKVFFPRCQILVVEDNDQNLFFIESFLQMLQAVVVPVRSAKEGLAILQQKKIDLIITDLHMQGMDGVAFIQAVRATYGKTPPIIAASADSFTAKKKVCLQAGANEFVAKPILLPNLQEKLEKYLPMQPLKSLTAAAPAQLKLSAADEKRVVEHLKNTLETPSYITNQIQAHAEAIIGICHGFETPYLPLAYKIKSLVYSKHAHQIPKLIEEVLADG